VPALYYLTEVVWPADGEMSGRPLKFRLVAQCATVSDCDRQAESRAKAHPESGFDASRDAWWGRDSDRIHYYHRTTGRPGRFWNGLKPKNPDSQIQKPETLEASTLLKPTTPESEEAATQARPVTAAGHGEQPGQGPDDRPPDRESEELPPIPGT
jgi:hypothetical protein